MNCLSDIVLFMKSKDNIDQVKYVTTLYETYRNWAQF